MSYTYWITNNLKLVLLISNTVTSKFKAPIPFGTTIFYKELNATGVKKIKKLIVDARLLNFTQAY